MFFSTTVFLHEFRCSINILTFIHDCHVAHCKQSQSFCLRSSPY